MVTYSSATTVQPLGRLLLGDRDDAVEGPLVAGPEQLLKGHGAQHRASSPTAAATRSRATTSLRATPSEPVASTRTYSMWGPTTTETLGTSVHGWVVQTSRAALSSARRPLGRQGHIGGEVLDLLVAHGHLGVRQGGLAPGAPGGDL